jgi:hypothetical protein
MIKKAKIALIAYFYRINRKANKRSQTSNRESGLGGG